MLGSISVNARLLWWFRFFSCYAYLITGVSRMLSVEAEVPKAFSIVGSKASTKECDIVAMVENGREIMADALTG